MLLIILVVLVAGSYYFFRDSGTAKNRPLEKVRAGNIGEHSIFNLIAKEKGYFQANGLDVEMTEYPSGPPAVSDLLSGKIDLTVAADFVGVSNIFTHPDLRILAQLSRHDVFRLIARKDKNITEPKDLKGKKIGVTRKSVGEFFLGRFLALNDLKLGDVQITDLPPQEIVKQLNNGQIEATVIFDPHAYSLRKSLADKVIIWSAQGEQKIFALLYSTDAFVKSRPQNVESYLRALLAAEQFLNNNDNEARQILAKKMGYEQAYVDEIWPEFDFRLSLDQALLLTMEDQARFIIDNKLTDQLKVPNYLENIAFAPLEKVKPEGNSIIP